MRLSKAALVASATPGLAADQAPTALRKQAPDSNYKILAHHLAFAPLDVDLFGVDNTTTLTKRFQPPFGLHESESSIFHRAAVALSLLQRRSSCPSGMSSCDAIGAPNKCCSTGTTCTSVQDSTVGHVACCPDSSSCGGNVGKCPSGAVTCPAELGGGCCIPGYVCQGVGCVPSAAATHPPETQTQTVIQTKSDNPGPETITKTQTTVIGGSASTVIVTQIVTRTESEKPTTKTTTQLVTQTGTVTGGAPWRPIATSSSSSSGNDESSSQEGCPTGFYGCLATHGGGCCRTDRSCQTYSCPPQASTTVVSDGVTLVVPVTNAPAQTTGSCANGWFLCGTSGGPVAGCCPNGYDCGTASCFANGGTQTGAVQKHLPGNNGAAARNGATTWALLGWAVAMLV